jgi:(2Fe-2S) ferredoxin
VYGYGRNGHEYYFDSSYAIEVNGNYYNEHYLHDNNIVLDVDGDYQERDDCVYVERDGEWYPNHDSRIVCKYNDGYDLRDECVYIEGAWYHEDDDADLIAQAQSKAEPLEETNIDE